MTKSVKMTLATVLLAGVSSLGLASAASAEILGLYARLDGGYSLTSITAKANHKEEVTNGYIVGASFGYNLFDFISVELTGSTRLGLKYTGSTINPTTTLPIGGIETKTNVSSYALMPAIRVGYGFDLGAISLKPYVSGAAGVAFNGTSGSKISASGKIPATQALQLAVQARKLDAATAIALAPVAAGAGALPLTVSGSFADASNTTFAYSAGAGIALEIAGFMIDLGYRYSDMGEFKGGAGSATYTVNTTAISAALGGQNSISSTAALVAPDPRHPKANEIMLSVGYIF